MGISKLCEVSLGKGSIIDQRSKHNELLFIFQSIQSNTTPDPRY